LTRTDGLGREAWLAPTQSEPGHKIDQLRSARKDITAHSGPVPESGGVSVLIIGLFAFGKTSIRQFNGCRGWQFKPSVIHSVLQARGEIRDFPAVDGELQLYLVSLENRASSKAHDFENSENNFR
jgi:hypothetical protein